jgi:IclR family KDG regulon transcriptional repressor
MISETSKKRIKNAPQVVEKALRILDVFAEERGPLGISELNRRLDMSSSTIYRILQVLLSRRYIKQDSVTNKYYLGYKILELSSTVLMQLELRNVARDHLEKLAKETSETTRLAIMDEGEIIYVDQVEGKDQIRLHLQLGSRSPAHCTAAGKCVMAFLEEYEVDAILSKNKLKAFTPKTITNIEKLKDQLRKIKTQGYAFNDEEYREMVRAVGSPIFDFNIKVLGSIVVVAPSFRLKLSSVPKIAQQVKRTALDISRQIGYH